MTKIKITSRLDVCTRARHVQRLIQLTHKYACGHSFRRPAKANAQCSRLFGGLNLMWVWVWIMVMPLLGIHSCECQDLRIVAAGQCEESRNGMRRIVPPAEVQ